MPIDPWSAALDHGTLMGVHYGIRTGGIGMDEIAMAAASALVGAMATDTWRQSREGLVALWRTGASGAGGGDQR
jgi:hypothetical protein